ncbi:ash family protein [Proteus mirabilis]|nr:ash family protein [Proteus mirabilis]QIM26737.1 ash family protein [Proteus mirabilis]HEI9804474.1 ash family protein [Proteus mirabilis]
MGYIVGALAKSNVRRGNLKMYKATIDATCVFFYVVDNAYLMANSAYTDSMVALLEHPKGWLVTLYTSISTSDNVTAPIERGNSCGDSFIKYKEIIIMMAIPTITQFKFLCAQEEMHNETHY